MPKPATIYLPFITFRVTAFVAFLLLEYTTLRTNSSLIELYNHTASNHWYFWLYSLLTLASTVLFGITSAWSAFRWQEYGLTLKSLFAGGVGSFFGIIASSCPVCGTTFLSSFSIVGSLSILPFQGLELKVVSLVLLLLSLYLLVTKKKLLGSPSISCPAKKTVRFNQILLSISLGSLLILLLLSFMYLKTDPLFTKVLSAQTCQNHK